MIVADEQKGKQMKVTGMVRNIDDLGRVVIPKEIRRTMGIPSGTPLEIYISEEGIVLKKKYQKSELHDLLEKISEAVEDSYAKLGLEKVLSIRQSIQDIQRLLK